MTDDLKLVNTKITMEKIQEIANHITDEGDFLVATGMQLKDLAKKADLESVSILENVQLYGTIEDKKLEVENSLAIARMLLEIAGHGYTMTTLLEKIKKLKTNWFFRRFFM